MKKKTKNAGKTPRGATRKAPKTATAPRAPKDATPRERDPRLPAAGTTLTRTYKGKDHKVAVLESGFRWDGKEWRSLSALAAAITGYKAINGFLWFRLTDEKAAEKPTPKGRKARGAAPKEAVPEAAPAAETATA